MTVCWLCHREVDRTDTHHVAQQAHGGTSGPTVELCPACHDRLHAAHLALQSRDPVTRRKNFFPPDQEARAATLLQALQRQQRAWEAAGKPGKQKLILELDRAVIRSLQVLKTDHGHTNLANFCAALLTQWSRARHR